MVNWTSINNTLSNTISEWGEDITVYELAVTRDGLGGEAETLELVDVYKASVQSTNEDDLLELPEGLRDKRIKKMYTTDEILEGYIVIRENEIKYKVMSPPKDHYVGGVQQFYKSFIKKVEEQ